MAPGQAETSPQCFTCGACYELMTRCGGCHRVHFCSHECQRAGWKQHKRDCHKLSAAPASPRSCLRVGGTRRSRSCGDEHVGASHKGVEPRSRSVKESPSPKARPRTVRSPPRRGTGIKQVRFCVPVRGHTSDAKEDVDSLSPVVADEPLNDSDLWMLIKDMRSEMIQLRHQREEDRQRSFELASRNKSLEGEVERLRAILEKPSKSHQYMSPRQEMETALEEDDDDIDDDDDARYLYGTTVRQRAQFWEQKKSSGCEDARQVSIPNRNCNADKY